MKLRKIFTFSLLASMLLILNGCIIFNRKDTTQKNILSHKTYDKIPEPEPVKQYSHLNVENKALNVQKKLSYTLKKDEITNEVPHATLENSAEGANNKFAVPIQGKIQSVLNKEGKTIGVRIFSITKQSVIAVADGVVMQIKINNPVHGNTIILNAEKYGLKIAYGGLDNIQFQVGDKISKGKKIGNINQDQSLYFAVKKNGIHVDPREYFIKSE